MSGSFAAKCSTMFTGEMVCEVTMSLALRVYAKQLSDAAENDTESEVSVNYNSKGAGCGEAEGNCSFTK